MLAADQGEGGKMDDMPERALAWYRAGHGAALATVVETWGSAPRPAGAQMAVSGDGQIAGSVSGGCVEGAVVFEAQAAMADGRSRVLTFGVSDDEAFAVGLACGGTIRVLVEPVGGALPEPVLAALVDGRAARRPVAVVSPLSGGTARLAEPGDHAERFRADRSGVEPDSETFVAIHNPPLRMAVVGAGHIAQALAPVARLAGWDVTLVDPRESFASEARFPGFPLVHDWPDAALAVHGLDGRVAVVTLTHDPKLDDPAIVAALRGGVLYLGCLGSPRTHGKRVERLHALGFTDADIARIHAPVGLDIGAKSPGEIAVSILAQVTQVLRQGSVKGA
jgi:xanthine dehydrogenase accessory factor